MAGTALVLGLGWSFASLLAQPAAGGPAPALPAILQDGFTSWTKGGGIDSALYIWQKGGLMDGGNKTRGQSSFLRSIAQATGSYRSYEWLESKPIGRSSQIIYLCINYEHGAVFARFLLYRTEKDWVVQDMDFSVKPESIMPWLALGEKNGE